MNEGRSEPPRVTDLEARRRRMHRGCHHRHHRVTRGLAAVALLLAVSVPYARPVLCEAELHSSAHQGPTSVSHDTFTDGMAEASCHGSMACGVIAVGPAIDIPILEAAYDEVDAGPQSAPRTPIRASDPPVPPPPRA